MIKNRWVTARCDSGACVEVQWVAACEGNPCVEVAIEPCNRVLVRDSKLGDRSPVIEYSASWWQTRCAAMKAMVRVVARRTTPPSAQEVVAAAWLPSGVRRIDNNYQWRKGDAVLTFTTEEWDTFVSSVCNGTFDI